LCESVARQQRGVCNHSGDTARRFPDFARHRTMSSRLDSSAQACAAPFIAFLGPSLLPAGDRQRHADVRLHRIALRIVSAKILCRTPAPRSTLPSLISAFRQLERTCCSARRSQRVGFVAQNGLRRAGIQLGIARRHVHPSCAIDAAEVARSMTAGWRLRLSTHTSAHGA